MKRAGTGLVVVAVVACVAGFALPARAQAPGRTPGKPCLDCCPNPPCEPILPPPGLRPPVRAAFYYPWWDGYDIVTGTPRAKWSDCSTTWADQDLRAHYHPDFNADETFDKSVDLYNDSDQSVMVTHMQRMEDAHIGGLIASWWGKNSGSGLKFRYYIRPAAEQITGVKITAYYESAQAGGETLDTMKLFFDEVMNLYGLYPEVFLTLGGERLVVFVYDPGNTHCGLLNTWKEALNYAETTHGSRPFLVVDMANDLQNRCTNYSASDFAWHEYAPPGASGYAETWANSQRQTNTIRPGFWRCELSQPGQVRSLTNWQSNVGWANSHRPTYYQLVTSWNEWLEMTAVEPAVEWDQGSISGLGSYLDVLAQNPPQ